MKTPCEDCTERVVGCHGKCERYQAYRAELDARKTDIYANIDYKGYVSRVKLKIALRRVNKIRRGWKKEK